VDTARDLFVELGVEAVTMREVAKRIDYTPTAIYHHFVDKDSLLTELCHRDFLALAQVFQKLGRIEDPIERLRRIGLAYLDFALEHPSQYRFMFITIKNMAKEDPGLTRGQPEQDAYAFLLQTILDGMEADRFRPEFDDPDLLAQVMWSGVHGVAALYIVKGHDAWVQWKDPRETGSRMVEALIRGVTR
jgi:AcrR family transcriptional regulator